MFTVCFKAGVGIFVIMIILFGAHTYSMVRWSWVIILTTFWLLLCYISNSEVVLSYHHLLNNMLV